jgi:hypothetical protein
MIAKKWTPPLKATEEEAYNTLYNNFYYIDGEIRTHHLWIESINTRQYRADLLGSKRIGFSGVGGEQYRNQERMLRKKWRFEEWVKHDLLLLNSGYSVLDKSKVNEYVDYISNKIIKELNISNHKFIDHYHVKRYFNEIYNPANRTLRTNVENQIAFFLSPFTDAHLSFEAYNALPSLGYSKEFEIMMIKALDRQIATVKTDYGYGLIRGEPLRLKYFSFAKEFLPKGAYNKIRLFRKQPSPFITNYTNTFPFARNLLSNVNDLGIPINTENLAKNAFLGPLLISLGFLIERIKSV